MRTFSKIALPALLLGGAQIAYAQDAGTGEANAEALADEAGPDEAALSSIEDPVYGVDPAEFPEPVAIDTVQREWPPYLGAYDPDDIDERGIWQQMEEVERKLATQKDILRDQSLNGYLEEVLCNTVGPERCSGVRIYVLRDASFNAAMYPNGMMVVHTGALLRLRNEAELAFLHGHDFAHYEERHGLQAFKKARSTTDGMAFFAMAGAAGSIVSLLMLSDLLGFSREQEQEADLVSTEYLGASRYTQRGAADVWVRMLDEDDARAEERKRGKRGRNTEWLDSHPAPFVRATYIDRAREIEDTTGIDERDRYTRKLAPFLSGFFDDQLKRNDFAASQYILEEIAADGWTADLLPLRGELYRSRGGAEDLTQAIGFYSEAISLGNNNPETWRGLGLAQLRSGAREEGQASLRKYLELQPDAPDAAMMKMMSGGL